MSAKTLVRALLTMVIMVAVLSVIGLAFIALVVPR